MHPPAFILPTIPLLTRPSTFTLHHSRPLHLQCSPQKTPRRPRRATPTCCEQQQPTWRTDSNLDILIPQSPSLILIFTGGLAASLSPRTTYPAFLTRLSHTTNAAILAHRTPPSNNHLNLARSITTDLTPHLSTLRAAHPRIPTFTIGHSLGAKLVLLASTDHTCRESLAPITANILISFCNRSAGDSVPWTRDGTTRAADTLSQVGDFLRNVDVTLFDAPGADRVRQNINNVIDAVETSLRGEFTPTPDETLAMIGARYHVARNLVVSFERDDLDDAPQLVRVLKSRFGDSGVIVRTLPGTHVTPMTPDLGGGFNGTGSEQFDGWVRDVGGGVSEELDALVAVVAAFLKLNMQIQK